MNYKNKLNFTKRKAFTLIELLIVIAIIGILFIVLVSKVDFATDKAKATGVQTDFRSFQLAFDTVAKENAGFNTFGWDTGDVNQNGKRDSYDEGDNGSGGGTAKNGIQDGTEVLTGHKVYDEIFTKVFSLKKAKQDGTLEDNYDRDALNCLEAAINSNLDPKLHITIADDGKITMANGAQDPWNKEYHGWYITNAETDKKDRGAIVMYSDGANGKFGSEHKIANGIVSISIPDDNKYGKDDYAVVSVYTFVNGYGEVKHITTGFSNNQTFLGGNNMSAENDNVPGVGEGGANTPENLLELEPGVYDENGTLLVDWETLTKPIEDGGYGLDSSRNYTWNETKTHANHIKTIMGLIGNVYRIVIPGDVVLGKYSFANTSLKSIIVKDGLTETPESVFAENRSLIEIVLPNSITKMGVQTLAYCTSLTYFDFPDNLIETGQQVCCGCESLKEVSWPTNVQIVNLGAFYNTGFVTVELPDSVQILGEYAFEFCDELKNIKLSNSLTTIKTEALAECYTLETVIVPSSVHTIEDKSFYGSGIIYITIPSTVQSIGALAFYQCYRLTEICNETNVSNDQIKTIDPHNRVIINNKMDSGIVKQGDFVFYDNNSTIYLVGYTGDDSDVVLPNYNNKEYMVRDYAFKSDRQIVNLVINDNVVDLNNGLYGLKKIKTITISSGSLLPAELYTYSKLTTLQEIYVPADLVEAYKNDTYWSIYADLIQPIQ